MILRLARALDVPLRERNGLLVAAGYAPMYREENLSAPELDRVELALATMLDSHDPFPAVVMDRGWNILRANQGARRLFGRLLHPQAIPDPANVLRLMIEPGPVQRSVLNWASVVPLLLERARREAVGGVLDRDTAGLVERLCELPGVATLVADLETTAPWMVVGWQASRSLRADLAIDALEMAVHDRGAAGLEGLVHHSDRGVQTGLNWSSQHRLVGETVGAR